MRGSTLAWLCLLPACAAASRVSCVAGADRVVIRDGAELFAEYRGDAPRGPALWPLLAPGGESMTRAYPFAEVDGEARDHPHHTSLWFAHGNVNGIDFWQGKGRIKAVGAPQVDSEHATIDQHCEWRGPNDELVADERRTLRFASGPQWRTVDLDTVLQPGAAPLQFRDTKEGTMALRLRQEFCLSGQGAVGHIRNSEGVTDDAVWGKRARWVAYGAEIGGVAYTVAMFDYPHNHGFPTTWHARGYGLCAANPFGLSDFEKAPKGAGDFTVPIGGQQRFRYRVFVRRGACDAGAIEAAWREFSAGG